MKSLLETLSITLPIIQAPMAGISTPAMAAAVSNVGALGSLGVGNLNAQGAHEMIRETQELTSRSINVNVFCNQPAVADEKREASWLERLSPVFAEFAAQPPNQLVSPYKSFVEDDELLDVIVKLRPNVVSFHFGLPSAQKIERLKSEGIVLLATATNLDEAKKIADAGIDAIVAQGYEAGGHRGVFEPSQRDNCLGLSALVRLLVSNLETPVIAAGGIMDGAGIVACLKLGAEAVQLGTAFVNCSESAADDYFRRALQSEAALHTTMTSAISGRPARCLANAFTKLGEAVDPSEIPDYPIAYHAGKALNAAAREAGFGGYGAHWAGQGAPLARCMPAAELIATLRFEMEEAQSNRYSSLVFEGDA